MVTYQWDTDLAVLRAVVEAEAQTTNSPANLDLLMIVKDAGVDLTNDELIKSLERLDGIYVDVAFNRGGGGILSYRLHEVLTPGRRATGQWPPDDAYIALVEILNERVHQASDEPTKGRLRAALDGLLGLGREVGVEVAAEWLSRRAGV